MEGPNSKSGFSLFLSRIRREGKESQWRKRLKEVQSLGVNYNEARRTVLAEMGFKDKRTELLLEGQYQEKLRRGTIGGMQEEIRAERAQENFDEVLASLPNNADSKTEIEWISAHPAMMRKNRQKDATKQIIITVDDLLCAPCGQAPSKAAASKLQHWANCPHEFFKNYTGDKKSIATEEKKDVAGVDPGVGEINALLKSLKRSTDTVSE